jgi:hypothetical protein
MAFIVLAEVGWNGAQAMTGACYMDRAPGGCFERETQKQKAENADKALRQSFLSLMEQTPAAGLPPFCKVAPDPRNRYATMAPVEDVNSSQMQTCIAAAQQVLANNQKIQQQQAQAAAKAARWKTIQADNGSVFKVELNSITHFNNGSADMVVYAVQSDAYDPRNLTRYIFDCHGHYMDTANMGTTLYAPPRSVAGQMANIACAGAKDTRGQ